MVVRQGYVYGLFLLLLALIPYFFVLSGYAYVALITAAGSALVVVNYSFFSHGRGRSVPYWVIPLPMLVSLITNRVIGNLFLSTGLAYLTTFAALTASVPLSKLEDLISWATDYPQLAVAVASASFISALTYFYVYGTKSAPIAYWLVAGPFLEYLIAKLFIHLTVNESGVLLRSLYSVPAVLIFLQPLPLTIYGILANVVKTSLHGRLVPRSLVVDYGLRILVVVLMNAHNILIPGSAPSVLE